MNPFRKKLDPKSALQHKIESYWHEVAYIMSDSRLQKFREYLIQAREHLDHDRLSEGYDAYQLAKREHNIARKKKQIFYRRNGLGMQIALVLVVLFSVATLVLWFTKDVLPLVLLTPLLAALGGGIGGCAAVLIQVIDVDPNSEVVSQFLWFVIKPTLGAALGLVTYFAVVSGLSMLTTGNSVGTFEGAVVVGFLAGFFESFSTGILARVANQFTDDEERDEPDADPEGKDNEKKPK